MSKALDIDSPAVQSYLTILQSVIGRMASNCASAKTWCIALVSAIIVVIADKGEPSYVLIALVPIGLFFILDAYYLGLERQFRECYNIFIKRLHEGNALVDDVFIVTPGGGFIRSIKMTLFACGSVSVWFFYVLLALMLLAIRIWIL
jgi:hypothetical protein